MTYVTRKNGVKIVFTDVGGAKDMRHSWRQFYRAADALVCIFIFNFCFFFFTVSIWGLFLETIRIMILWILDFLEREILKVQYKNNRITQLNI